MAKMDPEYWSATVIEYYNRLSRAFPEDIIAMAFNRAPDEHPAGFPTKGQLRNLCKYFEKNKAATSTSRQIPEWCSGSKKCQETIDDLAERKRLS
jgi:hypothetical protein